ncbi:RICIN domain-containing protein [Fulvivirga maritima]|uniref:RICIN domain-containing protein n=1 Tax=Fulvivirga maritima TaxID=2904247 RepID=UPI001F304AB7|nr:RICIN domain-containing protein [Fulvivirga maritima]UII25750.1 RICIN domain-containing protein [Fulvivirga maritima]
MFKHLTTLILLLLIGSGIINYANAYEHEVWQSGGRYYWKTFDVERGSSTDLAVAVEGAMGDSGNRDIHILTSGTLYSTINVSRPGVRIHGHGNTFTCSFSGSGILNNGHDGFEMHNLTLRNVVGGYGIRSSSASNLSFTDLNLINIDWIGIRIDSRTSNPWNYTEYNLYMRDILVENIGSHGIETYSIDGVDFDGTMTARNTGGCGVLLNQSHNGTIETVDAYNCDWGGGYAGLRFANGCSNITAETLYADRCGRGFFIVQSGPTINCHLNYAEIRECSDVGIWIENGTNCSVESGCSESGVAVSGAGSYANVTNNCSGGGSTSYVQFQNRATGLYLDGMGRTANGETCGQYANTTHVNSQWELVDAGGGYYQLRNRGTGLFLDGMGRTNNGAECGQYANTTHVNAQWSLQQYSGNYYRLQNRGTGLFLDGLGYTANGDVVGQWANSTSQNAQWQMINVGAGSRVVATKTTVIPHLNDVPDQIGTELFYPNPTTGVLNIRLKEHGETTVAKVYDQAGQMVMSEKLTYQNSQIDVSFLKSGAYFVEVSTASGINRWKLIKQ